MPAFLLPMTSFPIPGRVKDPVFLVSDTARAATSSMIPDAAFLERPNLRSCEVGHDLRFGYGFFGHFGPPVEMEFESSAKKSILEWEERFNGKS